MAQEELPYREIEDPTGPYTATTVTARMLDGLGFRYYWATEGLRSEDLSYKPSEEARTTDETLNHILGLSEVILNSLKQVPNTGNTSHGDLTFMKKRALTLQIIKKASDLLKASEPGQMAEYNIIFQYDGQTSEYPFWYQLNGPIADALWHVGQVVSFRRSAGNPLPSGVSFLSGKVRE